MYPGWGATADTNYKTVPEPDTPPATSRFRILQIIKADWDSVAADQVVVLDDWVPACTGVKWEYASDGATKVYSYREAATYEITLPSTRPSSPAISPLTHVSQLGCRYGDNLTPKYVTGPCSWGEYLLRPTLGGTYVVEVEATNRAGGQSTWRSNIFIADSTPPVVGVPVVAAGSSDPADGFVSRDFGGALREEFIGVHAKQLTITPLCNDPESGVHIAHLSIWMRTRNGDIVWLAPAREVTANQPTVVEFAARGGNGLPSAPGLENTGRPVEVVCFCWNGAGLFASNARKMKVAKAQPCDHWKLRLESATLERSWAQGTERRLTISTQRWGEYAITDDHAGLAYVYYHMKDHNTGEITPLPDLTHTDIPPARLSQFQLDLKHTHTYSVIATPVSVLAHASNVSWRITKPTPLSCSTEETKLFIDLTPPLVGNLSVIHYSYERKLPTVVTRRYQFRTDVAFIFAPGWGDPESGLASVEVTIISVQGTVLNGPKVLPPMPYIPFALGLKHLESFYYEWKATNFAGLTTKGRSLSVTIDVTKPIVTYCGDFGRVDDEKDYVRDASPLQVVWEAHDPDSGIDTVKWCIGTMRGSCDTAPMINVPRSMRVATRNDVKSGIGERVSPGIWYYSTVFVRNGAGTIVPRTADGFKLDLDPPVCAFVLDGPGVDYDWVGRRRLNVKDGFPLSAGFQSTTWHAFDTVSGIVSLEVALVPTKVGHTYTNSEPHDIDPTNATALVEAIDASAAGWKKVDSSSSSTGVSSNKLDHGTFYVAVVRAIDRVDRVTVCISDGFGADFTPPSAGYAISQLGMPQTVTHLIWLKLFDVGDVESGLYRIFASVGYVDPLTGEVNKTKYWPEVAFLGTSDEIVLTGLDLPQGDQQVFLRVFSNAGESNYTSVPIMVDSIPPVCSGVGLWHLPPGEKFFGRYLPDLVATWACNDHNGSGIVSSEWAVGQEPGSDDALPWISEEWVTNQTVLPWRFVDSPTTHHERNHSLLSGVRYFISVRTTDAAGNEATQVSAPFMLDNTPPFVTSPIILVHNSSHPKWPNRLARSWPRDDVLITRFKLDDLESGVRAIRVGLSFTHGALAHGWEDPLLTVEVEAAVNRYVLPMPPNVSDGTVGYLHVCAVDHVNLTACSPPFEFLVDLSPPYCDSPVDYIGGKPAGKFTSTNGAIAANTLICTDTNSILHNLEWQGYSHGIVNSTLLINPIYLGNPQDVLQVGGLQPGPSTLQGSAVAIVDMQREYFRTRTRAPCCSLLKGVCSNLCSGSRFPLLQLRRRGGRCRARIDSSVLPGLHLRRRASTGWRAGRRRRLSIPQRI